MRPIHRVFVMNEAPIRASVPPLQTTPKRPSRALPRRPQNAYNRAINHG
jgi:hypothetical protein